MSHGSYKLAVHKPDKNGKGPTIIEVSELDRENSDRFIELAYWHLTNKCKVLLADLRQVYSIDSEGLQSLGSIAALAPEFGCTFGIVADSPRVEGILRLSGVSDVAHIFRNPDDVIHDGILGVIKNSRPRAEPTSA